MRYSVFTGMGDVISVEPEGLESVGITVEDGAQSISHIIDKETFKELRKAIGYVWADLDRTVTRGE